MEAVTPARARPAVTPAPRWRFPLPTITSLDNGVEVWSFHLPGQHVLSVDVQIDLPLAAEPRDREGVASLTLRTSDEGTLAHPGQRIAEVLEDAGAAYGGDLDHDATLCTLDVPSSRLAQALPLLAEIVTTPEHDAADVARHVALRLAQLDHIRSQGPARANQALNRVTWWWDSRRSRPSGGLAETVGQVTRDDVADFHARHWVPAATRILIGGDLSNVGDVGTMVDAAFRHWRSPGARPTLVVEEPLPTPPGPVVHLVDRPGAVQVDLRIAGIGVDRLDPDFAALQTACVAVGGSFMSRLNRVLREERGYSYGVNLGSVPHKHAGHWTLAGSFRTEVAVAALMEARGLLDLTSAPLTDEEVDNARTQLVGLAPLRYDTPAAVTGQAARLAQVGLDADHVNRHFSNVAQVTTDRASEAFSRYIGPDEGHIVLVGDAAQLTCDLELDGYEVRPLTLD